MGLRPFRVTLITTDIFHTSITKHYAAIATATAKALVEGALSRIRDSDNATNHEGEKGKRLLEMTVLHFGPLQEAISNSDFHVDDGKLVSIKYVNVVPPEQPGYNLDHTEGLADQWVDIVSVRSGQDWQQALMNALPKKKQDAFIDAMGPIASRIWENATIEAKTKLRYRRFRSEQLDITGLRSMESQSRSSEGSAKVNRFGNQQVETHSSSISREQSAYVQASIGFDEHVATHIETTDQPANFSSEAAYVISEEGRAPIPPFRDLLRAVAFKIKRDATQTQGHFHKGNPVQYSHERHTQSWSTMCQYEKDGAHAALPSHNNQENSERLRRHENIQKALSRLGKSIQDTKMAQKMSSTNENHTTEDGAVLQNDSEASSSDDTIPARWWILSDWRLLNIPGNGDITGQNSTVAPRALHCRLLRGHPNPVHPSSIVARAIAEHYQLVFEIGAGHRIAALRAASRRLPNEVPWNWSVLAVLPPPSTDQSGSRSALFVGGGTRVLPGLGMVTRRMLALGCPSPLRDVLVAKAAFDVSPSPTAIGTFLAAEMWASFDRVWQPAVQSETYGLVQERVCCSLTGTTDEYVDGAAPQHDNYFFRNLWSAVRLIRQCRHEQQE